MEIASAPRPKVLTRSAFAIAVLHHLFGIARRSMIEGRFGTRAASQEERGKREAKRCDQVMWREIRA
jgi:hypothetical protein